MLKGLLALIKRMSFGRSGSTSKTGDIFASRSYYPDPKEYAESGQAFKDYMDKPLVEAAERSIANHQAQTVKDYLDEQYVHPDREANPVVGDVTPSNVFPIRHPDAEPPLFNIGNRRTLNPDWVQWEMKNSSCNEYEAYLIGALLMIDREFNGKMRKNVTILQRDPEKPLLVSIRYNDPGKPGAPQ